MATIDDSVVMLRMKFTAVARIKFGVEFDEQLAAFAWQVTLIPEARFHRIDDGLWKL